VTVNVKEMYGSFQERLLVEKIGRRNFVGECSFMILKVDYGEKEKRNRDGTGI
jgi:hypothetical protein